MLLLLHLLIVVVVVEEAHYRPVISVTPSPSHIFSIYLSIYLSFYMSIILVYLSKLPVKNRKGKRYNLMFSRKNIVITIII